MKLPNGSIYDGEFVEDIPRGAGKQHDVDEHSSYEGEFMDGLRHGQGRCEYELTGDTFDGSWTQGARFDGIMYYASGEVERVGFLNDKLVRREKLKPREQSRLLCMFRGEPFVDDEPEVQEAPEATE